jgi:hypothetical protein
LSWTSCAQPSPKETVKSTYAGVGRSWLPLPQHTRHRAAGRRRRAEQCGLNSAATIATVATAWPRTRACPGARCTPAAPCAVMCDA